MVIVLDLCNTLVSENTTRGFLAHLRRKRLSSWLVDAGLSRTAGRLSRLIAFDVSRALLIRGLRGISREVLYHEAQEYVRGLIPEYLNSRVVQTIREREKPGTRLCLATASLDPIAEAVAQHFDFFCIVSSKLQFRDGICTGRLEYDARGKKWESLRRHFAGIDEILEVVAITDNPEDVDLRNHATEFYWVSPQGEPLQIKRA